MGAITGTLIKGTEFAATSKLVNVTAAIGAASDTITLTEATHGIKSIDAVVGCIVEAPLVGHITSSATASGLVITVASQEGDGTAATVFGTVVSVTVLGAM